MSRRTDVYMVGDKPDGQQSLGLFSLLMICSETPKVSKTTGGKGPPAVQGLTGLRFSVKA